MDVAMVICRDVCLDDVVDVDWDLKDWYGCGSLYQRRDPLLGHSHAVVSGVCGGGLVCCCYELYYRTTMLVSHIIVM